MDVGLLLQQTQYALPIGVVLVCAILVFVFGFKKAEQPPFAQLSAGSDVDRKFASKKRSKIKEKKSANGQLPTEKASPVKKTVPTKADTSKKAASKTDDTEGKLKERKQDDNKVSVTKKEKEQVVKAGKENKVEQVKNKKNLKNLFQEKPVDFDEGDWEQAYSRKDKKNKKKEEESPSKKNKKNVKKGELISEIVKQKDSEKLEIKDKSTKETENKELKEKDKKNIITPVSNEEIVKENEQQMEEEEQPKIEKVEKEEKKSGKPKKGKKISESENMPTVPSTPKVDNKIQEEIAQEKENSMEIISDNSEPKNSTVTETETKSGPVFDELGDIWTEAKPQKKSKKKARKDN